MNEFLNNLKRQAEANPLIALTVVGAVLNGAARFVDAAGHARGSYAYAKDVERRVRASK